jgi:hypothetical protein
MGNMKILTTTDEEEEEQEDPSTKWIVGADELTYYKLRLRILKFSAIDFNFTCVRFLCSLLLREA